MKIAASILACDFGRIAEEISEAEGGGADWIHVDVMDGRFVPQITFGPLVARAARKATSLPLDVHLMVEGPDAYLEAFVDAGADLVTVHQEACVHLHRTVERIKELGALAGVALNPATSCDSLVEILPFVDLVLVMSVNPGFGGQSYIQTMTAKIRRARAMLDAIASAAELEVDGGIGPDNIAALHAAGVSVAVAGSAVFGHAEGARAGLAELRRHLGT